MSVRFPWIGMIVVCLLFPPVLNAQSAGSVSYKIDGKIFEFKDALLEYYVEDGYISITCEKKETVKLPSAPGGKEEVAAGMTIQLFEVEESIVGVHETSSADDMPVYFTWYELVPAKDGQPAGIRHFTAGLDTGDEDRMIMRLKIDNFGPEGALVKGTFSGKLFDQDDVLHEITDGTFSVPRKDVKDEG